MFNDTFYPTSPKGCEALVKDLENLRNATILDPSAGKGDILNYVCAHYRDRYERSRNRFHAIEKESELRAILSEIGYPVIHGDFLTYPGLQFFDYILMNPPFNEGAKHLLKAWDVANGAVIRCLLNSETLRNPYTKDRERLAYLVKEYGWSEELGQIFKGAERPSNVEVSLVHLKDTRRKETFRVDFEADTNTYTGDFNPEDLEDSALALPDIFANYEGSFMMAVQAFKELLLARQKVKHYLDPLLGDYPSPTKVMAEALNDVRSTPDLSYVYFLKHVTDAAWHHIFQKTKLDNVITEGVLKELEELKAKQGRMAFTAENMHGLFDYLFLNRDEVIKNCILEVFDEMTKYHKDNREAIEGWKTNTAYAVKSRFILPCIASTYRDGIDYQAARKLSDIEKALCFLDGRRLDSITSIVKVYEWYEGNRVTPYPWSKKIQSEFFETKFYKGAGTMHFLWLDDDLRVRFNRFVAEERWNWLPEKVKQGAFL